MGFLMHFRPFLVKKFRFFSDFAAFSDFSPIFFFFDDLLNIGLLPLPLKPPIPHGSPIFVFYKKIRKNREKIGFLKPTPKNGFQILNLRLKICIRKNFFNVLLPKFYRTIYIKQTLLLLLAK